MERSRKKSGIACIDVGYHDTGALAACVLIDDWADARASTEVIATIPKVEDYQPGEFYRRELPCIHSVLAMLEQLPSCIVVDGYVWLDGHERAGLGAHLFESLQSEVPVIGVAKNPFKGTDHAVQVFRGRSRRPLYVTAVGLTISQAEDYIQKMHGPHRLPTILKRVDQLSRQA